MNEENEIKWKALELDIQLYRHYLDLLLKFNLFFYAVTGAIVSFFVTRHDLQQARWALLLPVLMALPYAVLFLVGTCGVHTLLDDLEAATDHFGLGSVTDVRLLKWVLWITAGLLLVVAFSRSVLFMNPELVRPAKAPDVPI